MIRNIKLTISLSVYFILSRIIVLFTTVKDNKVLFVDDFKDRLDGNLKCMYDYLDSNKYEKVVCTKKDNSSIRSFKEFLRFIYNLSTSKYILLDNYLRCLAFIKVRKNQEVIQLWHGPGAFKKFGYSRPGHEKYKNSKIKGHKKYNKTIVTSSEIRDCIAEGFNMDIKNVYATGFPRMDIFFDKKHIKDTQKDLYKEYPILKDKKVILFAPTYRGQNVREAYYPLEELDLDKLYKELKDEYVFVFKFHPAVYINNKKNNVKVFDEKKYKDFFIDLSDFKNINDLLLVTDVLVTDYSSIIFDYVLTNKPIVYYTFDLDKFDENRGTYFEFDEYVYGPVVKNNKDLIESIKKEDLMKDKRKAFNKKFMDACDGKSTKRVFELIFKNKK